MYLYYMLCIILTTLFQKINTECVDDDGNMYNPYQNIYYSYNRNYSCTLRNLYNPSNYYEDSCNTDRFISMTFYGSNVTVFSSNTINPRCMLSKLRLESCHVQFFDPLVFANFDKLKEVYLSNNKLSNFTLTGTLDVLDVSHNVITDIAIESDRFHVNRIDLSYNLIHNISFLQYMHNSADINLSHNKINHLRSPLFSNNSNVELINLSNQQIDTIQSHVFSQLRHLREINLSNNNISNIKTEAFYNLPAVKIIDLSYNNILQLVANTFTYLPSLENINFNENILNYLSPNVFNNVTNIKSIHLSNQNLSVLVSNSLTTLTRLTSIHICCNNLTMIETNAFNLTTVVSDIDISQNSLKLLKTNMFSSLHFNNHLYNSSARINVSFNAIESIEKEAFNKLYEIGHADFSFNNMEIPENINFGGLVSLQHLNLQHNKLKALNTKLFNDTLYLVTLNLNNNKINTIPTGSFEMLSELKTLDLSNNLISLITTGTFIGLHSLNHLNLSQNKITFIAPIIFHNTPALEYLDVSHNKLNDLKANEINSIIRLKNIILDYNDYKCKDLSAIVRSFHDVNISRGRENGEISIHGIACDESEETLLKSNPESINALEKYFSIGFENSNFYKFFSNYKDNPSTSNNYVADEYLKELLKDIASNDKSTDMKSWIFFTGVLQKMSYINATNFVLCICFIVFLITVYILIYYVYKIYAQNVQRAKLMYDSSKELECML